MNQRIGEILERIYRRKPDLLVFSCYIWNIDMVTELAEEFHKLLRYLRVLSGPAGRKCLMRQKPFLRKNPAFTGVMMGEGERTFSALCAMYEASEAGTAAILFWSRKGCWRRYGNFLAQGGWNGRRTAAAGIAAHG